MARNGSGTYTLPSGNPVVSGTVIEANWANTTLSDLATAMTDSLSRSGSGGMTAALRIADGTQASPGLGFANETGSGFYRAGTAEVWAVIQGAQVLNLDATGVYVPAAKTTTIDGAFVFNEAGADKDARFEGDTDVNLLFTDASTDRVGVGTNTPSVKFHVAGDALLDGAVVINETGADKDTRIEGDTDVNLVFVDASTDRVGIGTSSPVYKLDVVGFGRFSSGVLGSGGLTMYGDSSSGSGMLLSTSGNLGIGTASPNTRLQVNAAAPTIRIEETTTGGSKRLELGVTSAGVAFISAPQSAQELTFQTVGTDRARISETSGFTVSTGAQTTPVAVTFSATAMTVNCSLSNVFTTTFTANVTSAPTISNPQDGQTINWFITQDGTGGRTMTWPTSFKWPGGTAGVLSAGANAVDLVTATYRSATGFWYATLLKAFS